MLDPRLWKTHVHQREQQFMREAERDRMAHEYGRARSSINPLWVALREVGAMMAARITATANAHAGTEPAMTQAPLACEKSAVSVLAEAEEVVRSYAGSPNDRNCCPC